MIDNIAPEIIRPVKEVPKTTVRLLYRPDASRQKLGKYFINEPVSTIIKDKNLIDDFLDDKNLEADQPKREVKRNKFGRRISEKNISLVEKNKSEREFVDLVIKYHEKIILDLEKKGLLLEKNQDKLLDPLSIGILYKIHSESGDVSLKHTLNFPELLESEQYKTAYKTALLSLAETSLDRFDNSNDTKELDTFVKYIRARLGDDFKNQPTSNLDWKNFYIKCIESNPEEFLKDYFIHFRFSGEEVDNSRNIFKLGEMVTGEVIEQNIKLRSKTDEVKDFLPYQDNERKFGEQKQYWRKKMIVETQNPDTERKLKTSLHLKNIEFTGKDGKKYERNRSKQALLDRGLLRETQDKTKTSVESEFIKIFSEYFIPDKYGKNSQNQMVLGMLYSMRGELGVGVLPNEVVKKRALEIVPGLGRVGGDIVGIFIKNNFAEYYSELAYMASSGGLGDQVKKESEKIFESKSMQDIDLSISSQKKPGETEQEFAKRRVRYFDFQAYCQIHYDEISKILLNSKYIDGFTIGEEIGNILKKTAEEKKVSNIENIEELNSRLEDENAVMKLLIDGEKIKDPGIRNRVEATMKKTSHLWRFTQRMATKAKIGVQNILFYSEGESPFLAKPSLGTEAVSAGAGVVMASSYGHFINHFMEDPVNRGVEAGVFMAGYFVIKEGGAYIKAVNTKKKELNLVKPKEYNPFSKNKLEYRKKMKEIKKAVRKDFWHNKGKLLYSSGSYLLTSIGVNYLLKQVGLSGSEAPMVLAATNVAFSGLLSGAGLRSGAEFIVNSLGSKKAVDGGMELLTGNKKEVGVERAQPVQKPTLFNKLGVAFATNIAPNIVRIGRKIEFVNKVMTRHEEENRHLQVLEKFVERKKDPNIKFLKDELIEAVEFLTLMKEEESMLLIHNPRFYSERKIRQPDGIFITIDNKKGLGKIDQTRKEIVEYAQNNLAKDDYDEVVESSLDFFADIKTIREKVFHKRMKYLVASYGYRATFMIMSHALQSQGGLFEGPINKIFGNATMDRQHAIEATVTDIFHSNISSPQGKEELAKEVWQRSESLNNLANLVNSTSSLPIIDNNLEYWGVNLSQVEGIVDNLKAHNMNTADLMRVVYVLSSYKEGQEYLSQIPGLDGTDHKTLTPLVEYFNKNDPYQFILTAVKGDKNHQVKGLSTFISLKYPDLAEKLQITPESLENQVKQLVIPNSARDQLLSGEPIIITEHGPQVISIGNIASEFVDGMTKYDRQKNIDFLIQMQGVLKGDLSTLQLAVNSHYASFLADANRYVNIADNPNLSASAINHLSGDSVIYKIYQVINPQSKDEIVTVVNLINKAKSGDVNAYAHLYQMMDSKNVTNLDKVFDSPVDSELYDKVLNGIPGDSSQARDEIVRRIQSHMFDSLSLRPVSVPIIDIDEMANIAKDPSIFINPRQALGLALSGKMDLEMAVNLSEKPDQIFVQNNIVVGEFRTKLQLNTTFTSQDLAFLNAIEGSESEDNQLTLPKMIKRNISYLLGRGPASGGTPPAASLIEKMTGGMGQLSMNPEAPSALHNYDKYGPDYLTKLIIAHFRGRVPEDLLNQMGPTADLTKSINDKDPSIIDRLCFKFESLIAGKQLTAINGEDKVHSIFLNHADMGTINGVDIKGVESASQVLFAKSFKDLSSGQKFMIEAMGQSPNEYLYDIKYDQNGNFVEMIPNPVKAINHAIFLIEQGKTGEKLDIFAPGQKEIILRDLTNMKNQANREGWSKVFVGDMKLPAEFDNYVATSDAASIQGMTPEQIHQAILNGDVISTTMTPNGQLLITLKEIITPSSQRLIPEELMTVEHLTAFQNNNGQMITQIGGLMTDAKQEGNFFITKSGINIPVIEAGNGVVVPGMAVIEIGPDNVISKFDETGLLSNGPQLIGSAYKPMEAFLLMKLHPEMNLGDQKYSSVSQYFQGQLITNSTHAIDNMKTMKLNEALANSANVPMVDMWTKLRENDPNIWYEYQRLAKEEFGIHFYEINKDGKFVEITEDPFAKNVALAVGNVFVGGSTPEESGMVHMAEVYKKIGEASVSGDPAGRYVINALNDPKYKNPLVWGQDTITKSFSPKSGDSLIAIKTGSQQGFNPETGEPMAIRNVVAVVKIDPDGKVTSTFLETTGIDASGKPVELGWGSELIPVARGLIESAGITSSPESAQQALNQLFVNPENVQNYQLGAVSMEQLYPFLKSLSSEEQYSYLRESILHDKTKYLFVDLIGAQHQDKTQPIAIHFIDPDGKDRLFTLNISANIIKPAGSLVNHFADTSDQTVIYELLAKANQENPEKYGGLLTQLQSQGVNFVPIHNYESSPALFTLHEQMKNNKMLFAGAEDAGSIMKQLGLDPKTTVFVNSETFDLYSNNQKMITESIFAQREYLALSSIYENSGSSGSLDRLLYNSGSSNEIYQLLKVFIETKTSQTFVPITSERSFLVKQFESLINNPEKTKTLAPDVIRAYQLYSDLSAQITRGENPDPTLSKQFIEAIQRFPGTTNEKTLLSLGIGVQPVQTSTPLPASIVGYEPSLDILKASGSTIVTAVELANNFLKHPENFQIPEGEKSKLEEVVKGAVAIINVINSPETQAIKDKNLQANYIVEKLANDGLVVDHDLVSQLVGSKQCVMGYLVLNDALAKEGVPGFINMQGRGGVSAKSFIDPLLDVLHNNINTVSSDHVLMKTVNNIIDVHAGDTFVVYLPWMGENEITNPGHIVQVLFTGTHPDGSPYMVVFDTNGDNNGTTAIREINNLNDFVSQNAWDSLHRIYPKPELVSKLPDPIFAIMRPEN